MLDFYRIDFDQIAEVMRLIAKSEPVNVFWIFDENLYLITYENGKTLRLEWSEKKKNNTRLTFSDDNFIYFADFASEPVLKVKVMLEGNKQYEVRYMPLSQNIDFFDNEKNYITIQFDDTDEEIFDIMMNQLECEGEFENFICFMKWFSSIFKEKNISDACITYRERNSDVSEMLEISDGVVQFYTYESDDEMFRVDTYGSWIARVKNMKGWYDARSKKHTFDQIKNKKLPAVEFGVAVDRMNEMVPDMFERLKV